MTASLLAEYYPILIFLGIAIAMAVLMVVGDALPDAPAPSLLERARDAGAEVVWTFGLGG